MAKKLQHSAREVQSIAGAGYHLKNPQAQNRRHVARMVMVFILGTLFAGELFIFHVIKRGIN